MPEQESAQVLEQESAQVLEQESAQVLEQESVQVLEPSPKSQPSERWGRHFRTR